MQIGENIRQARESAGFSQVEMAQKLGVKRTTYINWEKNIEPDFQTIKKIANILDMPSYKLLKGIIEFSEEPEPIDNDNVTITLSKSDAQKIKESLTLLQNLFPNISNM